MIVFLRQFLVMQVLLWTTFSLFAAGFPLKPFKAHYSVSSDNDEVARTTLHLYQDGNDIWHYISVSEPTGWMARMLGTKVTEHSRFIWQEGIHVQSYRYDRNPKEKHVSLDFDWQNMKVTNTINGDPWQMKIPAGTQDKLSIDLALKTKLSIQEASTSFPVADGGKLKTYDFKLIGHEILQTSLGKLQTLKLSRNKRGRTNGETTLWLAPDLNYLTIKIEKTDTEGRQATISLSALDRP